MVQFNINKCWCLLLLPSPPLLLFIMLWGGWEETRRWQDFKEALTLNTQQAIRSNQALPLSHTPTHPRTYTHPHPHPFSVLELATGCIPVRSAQYSTLPKKKTNKLSLLIALWRPHIATVIVVSQQSITHQCETATLMQRKHNATSLSFPPKSSVLWNLHPAAWPPSCGLSLFPTLSPYPLLPRGCKLHTHYHLTVIHSLYSLPSWWPSQPCVFPFHICWE